MELMLVVLMVLIGAVALMVRRWASTRPQPPPAADDVLLI